MTTPLFALFALAAALSVRSASAASFDCAKASTPTEKAICADPILSSLDEQLEEIAPAASLELTAAELELLGA